MELKACPFCGVELIFNEDNTFAEHPNTFIGGVPCLLIGHEVWLDTPGDIATWNTRAKEADDG